MTKIIWLESYVSLHNITAFFRQSMTLLISFLEKKWLPGTVQP